MTSPAGGAPNNKGSALAKAGRTSWPSLWMSAIVWLIVTVAASLIVIGGRYGWQKYEESRLASKTVYWIQGNDNALGGGFYTRLYTVTNPNRVKIANVSLLAKTSEMPKEGRLWFETQPMCVTEEDWKKNPSGMWRGQFTYHRGGEAALPAGASFTVTAIWRNVLWKNITTPEIHFTLDASRVKTIQLPPGTAFPPPASSLPSFTMMFLFCFVVSVSVIATLFLAVHWLRRDKFLDVQLAVAVAKLVSEELKEDFVHAPRAAREREGSEQDPPPGD